MAGAPFITRFCAIEDSVNNMRTEGILRLLSGGSFALSARDRDTLHASPQWAQHLASHPHLDPAFRGYHAFAPLRVECEDTFLWSPFSDALCSFTTATDESGMPFPFLSWPMNVVFQSVGRVPLASAEAHWHALAAALAHVKRKGVVLYPPDLIPRHETDAAHARDLMAHINRYNDRAASIMRGHGWKVFIPAPQPDSRNTYWAHFSTVSRQRLWEEICAAFDIPLDREAMKRALYHEPVTTK